MKRRRSASQAVTLIDKRGVATAEELRQSGIHPEQTRRLIADGQLIRLARGIYSTPTADLGEHASLIVAAMAVPHGVICLLSALRFHGIGTQLPAETWVAIRRRDAVPRSLPPGIRIVSVSEPAFSAGIEEVMIHRHAVRVYGPAKTVADCFKFRGAIGLEAALEALRETLRRKLATRDAIWRHAKTCRVTRTLLPYLEAMA